MNKKVYQIHNEGGPEHPKSLRTCKAVKARQTQEDASTPDRLDFLCDCGEPVSPVDFAGFYPGGIRLRARCFVCGQNYEFKLKVNLPPDPALWDDRDPSGHKIINRIRLKEI